VVLLNAIMHVILKEKLTDKKFIAEWTEGFEVFAKTLDEYTLKRLKKSPGCRASKLSMPHASMARRRDLRYITLWA